MTDEITVIRAERGEPKITRKTFGSSIAHLRTEPRLRSDEPGFLAFAGARARSAHTGGCETGVGWRCSKHGGYIL